MSSTVAPRGPALTAFAVLFGLLAVSNFLKPFELGETTGFVLFGQRLKGAPNAIVAPLFGLYLATLAAAIWRLRRRALPMAWIYLGYVVANLVLFRLFGPPMPGSGVGALLFGLAYMSVAVGVPLATAILLRRRQTELG